MTQASLDDLKDQYPGCETLAFADLSTQMVLLSKADKSLPREALDALCAEAALLLGTKATPAVGDSLAGLALIATPAKLRIYLRAAQQPGDALCCTCHHDIPVDAFVNDARACLERISQDG